MGFLGKFECDRCGYGELSKTKDNYGGSVTRYDAETWLCDKCSDGVRKAIYDYIHGTGPYHHMNQDGE